ncbi:hypothetical protein GCM10028856_38950 [Halopiger thermotolerans]
MRVRDRLRSLCRGLGAQYPRCESARTIGIPATPGLRHCFNCGDGFNDKRESGSSRAEPSIPATGRENGGDRRPR